ncbi:MAG: DUF2283 domain-containing protein [Chloroflexi bacterium]|nr:DUF2283 domain-containing protein [Chloroflexota bacterium]
MKLRQFDDADAAYVDFETGTEVARTVSLGDSVQLDYDARGTPVGVTFLYVSEGVQLGLVPVFKQQLNELLTRHKIRTATPAR